MTDKLRIPYKDYLLSVDCEFDKQAFETYARMRIVDLKTESVMVVGKWFYDAERPNVQEYMWPMLDELEVIIGAKEEEKETFEQFIDRLDAAISRAIQEAYGA